MEFPLRASRLAPDARLLLAVTLPATARQAWTGGYVGAYAGASTEPDDDADRFLFDTNLDGAYGDTVRTATGADAFSPGFCNGVARDRTPTAGCDENSGGADYGLRAGYDWQSGTWVVGAVLDVGGSDARDAVSAFSTTPARYTMLREVDTLAALRALRLCLRRRAARVCHHRRGARIDREHALHEQRREHVHREW